MKEYQEALDYLTKLERADNFIRTGDVVPHPASDLLQNLLSYFKNTKLDLHNDLDKYLVALQNLGSIEVYPEENIYVSDYEEFDILKNLLISQKQSTFKECVEKWKNKNFIVNDYCATWSELIKKSEILEFFKSKKINLSTLSDIKITTDTNNNATTIVVSSKEINFLDFANYFKLIITWTYYTFIS